MNVRMKHWKTIPVEENILTPTQSTNFGEFRPFEVTHPSLISFLHPTLRPLRLHKSRKIFQFWECVFKEPTQLQLYVCLLIHTHTHTHYTCKGRVFGKTRKFSNCQGCGTRFDKLLVSGLIREISPGRQSEVVQTENVVSDFPTLKI